MNTSYTRIRQAGTAESGQGLAETAIAMTVMLLLIFAVVDLGRVAFVIDMLATAAQAGARTGSVTSQSGRIQTSIQAQLTMVNPADVEILIDRTSDYTEVTLNYRFQPITPLATLVTGVDGIPLSTAARMQVLGVVSEGP